MIDTFKRYASYNQDTPQEWQWESWCWNNLLFGSICLFCLWSAVGVLCLLANATKVLLLNYQRLSLPHAHFPVGSWNSHISGFCEVIFIDSLKTKTWKARDPIVTSVDFYWSLTPELCTGTPYKNDGKGPLSFGWCSGPVLSRNPQKRRKEGQKQTRETKTRERRNKR